MSAIGVSTDTIDVIINDTMSRCIATIKTNSRAAGQVATGKTLRSLEYTLQRLGKSYVARILGRPYFGTLETGRGPYNGGKGDPQGFNQRLIEWMKARNFQCKDEAEYLRMANYLRWKINKFGTELYRKGGRKDIFTPAVDDMTELLEKELIVFFQTTMEDMFTKGFQGFGRAL